MREAQRPVQTFLDESFGTPNDLVAWRKLPVDFGEFEGTVVAQKENSLTKFKAELKSKTPQPAEKLSKGALKGSALLWTSGANKDLKFETAKKETGHIEFHIADFDPESGTLSVIASQNVPGNVIPAVGDQFVVVGSGLQHGRKLYLTHCMHCHGVSGDGNGPTAEYLNPRPRDYRKGLFKFTSTLQSDKACREDLARTILQGIPGTYMPSFLLLKDDEVHAIVEYVRWLAMRGEMEQRVVVEFEGGGYTNAAKAQRVKDGEKEEEILKGLEDYVKTGLPGAVDTASTELGENWSKAEEPEAKIVPKKKRTPDDAASRARGRELYLSAKAKCATCHGPLGRGDGPQTEDFMAKPGTNEKFDKPGLYDEWGQPIKPRNLMSGIYRGGRRPIDIYRRIRGSIKGTPMPSFTETTLSDDEAWDLVNYVLSIPYEGSPQASHPQTEKTAAQNEDAAKPNAEKVTGNVAAVSESGGN